MAQDRKAPQQVIQTTRTSLVWASVIWDVCTESKDTKRKHPPSHNLFTLLPSDNRNRSICCHTSRLQCSSTPHVMRLQNSSSILHFYLLHVLLFISKCSPFCKPLSLRTRLEGIFFPCYSVEDSTACPAACVVMTSNLLQLSSMTFARLNRDTQWTA